MVQRWQGLGIHEPVGQGRIAEPFAPHLHGVIDHLFLGAAAVLLQHLAGIGIGKDRFDPGRYIAGIEADRAGRRDGGQKRIADAVLADRRAHIGIHMGERARGEELFGVEQRERPLFACQIDRGQIGRPGNGLHPGLCLRRRRFRAIAQAQHQQGIGQPGNPQPDAPLCLCLCRLFRQRKARRVDDIVHHPDRHAHQIIQCCQVQLCPRIERLRHQPRHVDGAEQAGPIGRQRLFTAGICGGDGFAICKVIQLVDPVDEDHARLGHVEGGPHDAVPQIARVQRFVDTAIEDQLPRAIGLDGGHEGIGHQHGQVEHPQAGRVFLGLDEGFDIGVVAAHGGHHRPAPAARRHDGAAHRIPDIHEGQGTRGIGGHTLYPGPARADGGKVVPDAAALLHGQRGFLQHLEDARQAVRNGAHDKAVEQRHRAARARPGGDAPRWKVFEILQRRVKAVFPGGRVRFGFRQRAGDAPPGVFHRAVQRRAVDVFQAVLHIPDLLGDGGGESGHGRTLGLGEWWTRDTR